jgi:hypothetical protein
LTVNQDQNQNLLTIEQARRHPMLARAGGEPIPFGTFIRWTYTGCRGVLLQTELRGGKRLIAPSAIERFVAAIAARWSGPARRLMQYVGDHGGQTLDEIAAGVRRKPATVSRWLMRLCADGLLCRVGSTYAITGRGSVALECQHNLPASSIKTPTERAARIERVRRATATRHRQTADEG